MALSKHSSQITAWYSFMSKHDPYQLMIVMSDAEARLVDSMPASTSSVHRYVTAFSHTRHGVSGGRFILPSCCSFACG